MIAYSIFSPSTKIENSMKNVELKIDRRDAQSKGGDKERGGNRGRQWTESLQKKNLTSLAIFCPVAVLDSICSCVLAR